MRNRRMPLLLSLLFALVGATAVWAHGRMAAEREASERMRRDLTQIRRDAAAIRQHKDRPAVALDSERLASETTRLIEQAARQAGIGPAGLSRITPAAAVRMGNSAYLQKPTQVLLLNVTLQQAITLAHSLAGEDAGLSTKSIRLSAPRHESNTNVWTVELVLVYLVYDPPQTGR